MSVTCCFFLHLIVLILPWVRQRARVKIQVSLFTVITLRLRKQWWWPSLRTASESTRTFAIEIFSHLHFVRKLQLFCCLNVEEHLHPCHLWPNWTSKCVRLDASRYNRLSESMIALNSHISRWPRTTLIIFAFFVLLPFGTMNKYS